MAISLGTQDSGPFGDVGNDSGVSFKWPSGVIMPDGVEGEHVWGDQHVCFFLNRKNMGESPFPEYWIRASTRHIRRDEVGRLSSIIFTCDQQEDSFPNLRGKCPRG